jgi:hypothetical protein
MPFSEAVQSETRPSLRTLAGMSHVRSRAVVSRHVAGETIIVPICRGAGDLDSVYMLNKLGGELWVLLEQSRTTEELANWVTHRYEVRPEQALRDVHSYLAELLEVDLIHSI